MFIVFGILSILSGCLVFQRGNTVYILSSLAGHNLDYSAVHFLIGISFIVAGSMLIASHDGRKQSFITYSIIPYAIAFIFSVSHFYNGDMPIWTIASAAIIIINMVWLFRHPDPASNAPKTTTYIDPDLDRQNDNAHQE